MMDFQEMAEEWRPGRVFLFLDLTFLDSVPAAYTGQQWGVVSRRHNKDGTVTLRLKPTAVVRIITRTG